MYPNLNLKGHEAKKKKKKNEKKKKKENYSPAKSSDNPRPEISLLV